jgi:LysR family transcriptional regulator, carnitine catabolism transcriptional activator
VAVASPELDRPIHLVWQTSRVLGPAPQAFVDLLEASVPRKKRTGRATA